MMKVSDGEGLCIKEQPPTEWEWCIAGDWFTMTIHTCNAPHIIGRFFQKWLLDIHWRKIEDK